MSDAPLEITYSTTTPVKRTGPVGRGLGWIGAHPVWGGFICGVAVVLIAALRSPGGVMSEPATAALLSGFVILTWMVLFYLMRSFFAEQSYIQHTVIRRIKLSEEEATWEQDGTIQRRITKPRVRLLATPVSKGIGEGKGVQAWPVWIVIEGQEDEKGDEGERPRIIIETRDSARRAREYEAISQEIAEKTDEKLPRALIIPLLELGK